MPSPIEFIYIALHFGKPFLSIGYLLFAFSYLFCLFFRYIPLCFKLFENNIELFLFDNIRVMGNNCLHRHCAFGCNSCFKLFFLLLNYLGLLFVIFFELLLFF